MARADLDVWESGVEGVFARIRSLFYRTESKKHAEQYFWGLLSSLERKNGWTIAEHEAYSASCEEVQCNYS